MSANKRISKVLAMLLPTGVLGISSALAATQIRPNRPRWQAALPPPTLRTRLAGIRKAVSDMDAINEAKSGPTVMLAEWLNVGGGVGWRNGGWGNGGWHNWGKAVGATAAGITGATVAGITSGTTGRPRAIPKERITTCIAPKHRFKPSFCSLRRFAIFSASTATCRSATTHRSWTWTPSLPAFRGSSTLPTPEATSPSSGTRESRWCFPCRTTNPRFRRSKGFGLPRLRSVIPSRPMEPW